MLAANARDAVVAAALAACCTPLDVKLPLTAMMLMSAQFLIAY